MVNASLEIAILVLVPGLQALQMVQLAVEVSHLLLKRGDLSISLIESLLLAFQVKALLIKCSVELFNLIKRLGNFKFQRSDVAT